VAPVPDEQRISSGSDGGGKVRIGRLTPAEAHALSRSAPLTPAQFRARRQVAEQRNVPLHVLLNGIPGRFSQRRPDSAP
jgi:hypothetical protein